jgi:hypothetical protein
MAILVIASIVPFVSCCLDKCATDLVAGAMSEIRPNCRSDSGHVWSSHRRTRENRIFVVRSSTQNANPRAGNLNLIVEGAEICSLLKRIYRRHTHRGPIRGREKVIGIALITSCNNDEDALVVSCLESRIHKFVKWATTEGHIDNINFVLNAVIDRCNNSCCRP